MKHWRILSCSLSPNLRTEDLKLCAKYLFLPWYWIRWYKGEMTDKLREQLKQTFGWKKVFFTHSGRGALYLTLKAMGIKKGDEVITQAFSCAVVANAILACGATPVFVDVSPETLTLDIHDLQRKTGEKTKAIIVQHTFGIPADIETLVALAKNHHIKVIESLAHSFGNSSHGKLLGTFGDAAIFSFGRDKVVSSVEGGGVGLCSDEYASEMSQITKSLPRFPVFRLIQDLLHPFITTGAANYYFLLSLGKIILFLAQKLHLINKVLRNEDKSGDHPHLKLYAYPHVLAHLAFLQMQDIGGLKNHQASIAHIYEKGLKNTKKYHLLPHLNTHFLRFPILALMDICMLQSALKKRHIELGDWYRPVITGWRSKIFERHYTRGSCPVAEKISAQIFNLPCGRNIDEKEAEKIVAALMRL